MKVLSNNMIEFLAYLHKQQKFGDEISENIRKRLRKKIWNSNYIPITLFHLNL
jgi:hypothetical protein